MREWEKGEYRNPQKVSKKAGIGKASLQTLCHTFGTHHIVKGTDPKTLQDVLGLKEVRSTAIYRSQAK